MTEFDKDGVLGNVRFLFKGEGELEVVTELVEFLDRKKVEWEDAINVIGYEDPYLKCGLCVWAGKDEFPEVVELIKRTWREGQKNWKDFGAAIGWVKAYKGSNFNRGGLLAWERRKEFPKIVKFVEDHAQMLSFSRFSHIIGYYSGNNIGGISYWRGEDVDRVLELLNLVKPFKERGMRRMWKYFLMVWITNGEYIDNYLRKVNEDNFKLAKRVIGLFMPVSEICMKRWNEARRAGNGFFFARRVIVLVLYRLGKISKIEMMSESPQNLMICNEGMQRIRRVLKTDAAELSMVFAEA